MRMRLSRVATDIQPLRSHHGVLPHPPSTGFTTAHHSPHVHKVRVKQMPYLVVWTFAQVCRLLLRGRLVQVAALRLQHDGHLVMGAPRPQPSASCYTHIIYVCIHRGIETPTRNTPRPAHSSSQGQAMLCTFRRGIHGTTWCSYGMSGHSMAWSGPYGYGYGEGLDGFRRTTLSRLVLAVLPENLVHRCTCTEKPHADMALHYLPSPQTTGFY